MEDPLRALNGWRIRLFRTVIRVADVGDFRGLVGGGRQKVPQQQQHLSQELTVVLSPKAFLHYGLQGDRMYGTMVTHVFTHSL